MQKVLYARSGSGYRVAKDVEIQEATSFIEARKFEADRPVLTDPLVAKNFLIEQLQHSPYECFCVIYLDTRTHVITFEKMFRGTDRAQPSVLRGRA